MPNASGEIIAGGQLCKIFEHIHACEGFGPLKGTGSPFQGTWMIWQVFAGRGCCIPGNSFKFFCGRC